MTTTVSSRPIVTGPTPSPAPYGLFSVLTFSGEGSGHWQAGVGFESDGCYGLLGIGDPSCTPLSGADTVPGLPKDFGDEATGPHFNEASPFSVYASYQCSPGGRPVEDAQTFADRRLLAREEQRVEQALWTGDLGNRPWYGQSAEDLGKGYSLSVGLGLLEEYAAQHYGGQGVIHLSRAAAMSAVSLNLAAATGGMLRTVLGTPVAAGGGYAPLAGTDGIGYVTPPLFGYRSNIFTSSNRSGDLLDRAVNWLVAVAERTYLVGWNDCGVARVGFGLETAGGDGVGTPGASAYEVAVTNGFEGTEEEWLASLKGPKGDAGTKGDAGAKGDPGTKGDPGAPGVVQSVVAGDGLAVDATDPANPVISASGA